MYSDMLVNKQSEAWFKLIKQKLKQAKEACAEGT